MHDLDVRRSLHDFLQRDFAHDPSTVIADELGILQGRVRIDVAAINGSLYGFEIKAAADSLDRLPAQAAAYGRVLDYAVVVAADKHLGAAENLLPTWWGIYRAAPEDGALAITCARSCQPNPTVEARALAELIWHGETLDYLEARGAAQALRRKPRAEAWDRLCEVYTLSEVRDLVRATLKGRAKRRAARPPQ